MKFLTLEQFTEMWKLQDELNTQTSGPDWKEKNQNWNLAIKSEVMEFFDYIGWKWWKTPDQTKKPSDMQARLELVDIWHFLLSDIIENTLEPERDLESKWERFKGVTPDHDDFYYGDWKEALAEMDMSFNHLQKINNFAGIFLACEWSWDELYKAYIGKVALNAFRQANGYKEGTYQKIWGHCGDPSLPEYEDNYFLEQLLTELSLTPGALTYQAVYHKLGIEYMCRTQAS